MVITIIIIIIILSALVNFHLSELIAIKIRNNVKCKKCQNQIAQLRQFVAPRLATIGVATDTIVQRFDVEKSQCHLKIFAKKNGSAIIRIISFDLSLLLSLHWITKSKERF